MTKMFTALAGLMLLMASASASAANSSRLISVEARFGPEHAMDDPWFGKVRNARMQELTLAIQSSPRTQLRIGVENRYENGLTGFELYDLELQALKADLRLHGLEERSWQPYLQVGALRYQERNVLRTITFVIGAPLPRRVSEYDDTVLSVGLGVRYRYKRVDITAKGEYWRANHDEAFRANPYRKIAGLSSNVAVTDQLYIGASAEYNWFATYENGDERRSVLTAATLGWRF
jgi:hypothetical protein